MVAALHSYTLNPAMRWVALALSLALAPMVLTGCSASEEGTPTGKDSSSEELSSSVFQPHVTYTAPVGWTNPEDVEGLFTLLPPGITIGEYFEGGAAAITVAAEVTAAAEECTLAAVPNLDASADSIVASLQGRASLSVSTPEPVTVGGLDGQMIEVGIVDGAGLTCPQISETGPTSPALIGVGTSSGWGSGAFTDSFTRYYLLDRNKSVMAVSIDANYPESDERERDVTEMAAIVDSMQFAE